MAKELVENSPAVIGVLLVLGTLWALTKGMRAIGGGGNGASQNGSSPSEALPGKPLPSRDKRSRDFPPTNTGNQSRNK